MEISAICNALEQQQKLLANNQQTIKEELTQEVSKNVEYGVPSEGKKEPPGLLRGGDDRGLGVKRDQQIEGTEEKGPKGKYFPRETDPKQQKG